MDVLEINTMRFSPTIRGHHLILSYKGGKKNQNDTEDTDKKEQGSTRSTTD
ncbi:12799_t:CDS:2, partial [Acaulospora morrowiae]